MVKVSQNLDVITSNIVLPFFDVLYVHLEDFSTLDLIRMYRYYNADRGLKPKPCEVLDMYFQPEVIFLAVSVMISRRKIMIDWKNRSGNILMDLKKIA